MKDKIDKTILRNYKEARSRLRDGHSNNKKNISLAFEAFTQRRILEKYCF